jgi:hypothetical protein
VSSQVFDHRLDWPPCGDTEFSQHLDKSVTAVVLS